MSDVSYDDISSTLSLQLTLPFNYLLPAMLERPPLGRDLFGGPPASANNNIKVICRFRPNLDQEREKGGKTVVEFPNSLTCTLVGRDFTNHFVFDRTFEPETTQHDVYQFLIRQTVDDLMNGYNGTVLAYGQTGLGKLYTMMGLSLYDDDERGIIPRISEDIFDHIGHGLSDVEYTVGIAYYEIYMEQIRDLLDTDAAPAARQLQLRRNGITCTINLTVPALALGVPGGDPLGLPKLKFTIHQDKTNGIYVKGLSHAFVLTLQEMLTVLQRGLKNRTNGQTLMNTESLRLHAIFQIKLTQKHVSTEIVKRSQLFLVDLAGLEKVDKTGAMGQTLEEAKKINSLLLALGNVINALTDGKLLHVPYRDLKLTRILQELLGGNSRTSLIINCLPLLLNEGETLLTLRFGTRAKNIKNLAHVNTELSAANLKTRLQQMEKLHQQNQLYIKQLELELTQWRSGAKPQLLLVPPLVRSLITLLHNNHLHLHNHQLTGPGLLLLMIYLPLRDFQLRLPLPTLAVTPLTLGLSLLSTAQYLGKLPEEIERRDKKIAELEDMLLNYKMDKLRNLHLEELKLFTLENLLTKVNDKLTEVELVNVNLRKHLLILEKIIELRDVKINKLKASLKEQQLLISKETLGFRNKLGDIQLKLEYLNQQKQEEISIMKRNSAASLAAVLTLLHNGDSLDYAHELKRSDTQATQATAPLTMLATTQKTARSQETQQTVTTTNGSINSFATTERVADTVPPLRTGGVMNFQQEYILIGEFLAELRRRSKLIQLNIQNDLDSLDTLGMFGDDPPSPGKLGLNLRIIKPFRGGLGSNSARSSKVDSVV